MPDCRDIIMKSGTESDMDLNRDQMADIKVENVETDEYLFINAFGQIETETGMEVDGEGTSCDDVFQMDYKDIKIEDTFFSDYGQIAEVKEENTEMDEYLLMKSSTEVVLRGTETEIKEEEVKLEEDAVNYYGEMAEVKVENADDYFCINASAAEEVVLEEEETTSSPLSELMNGPEFVDTEEETTSSPLSELMNGPEFVDTDEFTNGLQTTDVTSMPFRAESIENTLAYRPLMDSRGYIVIKPELSQEETTLSDSTAHHQESGDNMTEDESPWTSLPTDDLAAGAVYIDHPYSLMHAADSMPRNLKVPTVDHDGYQKNHMHDHPYSFGTFHAFKCYICGKKFMRTSALQAHLKWRQCDKQALVQYRVLSKNVPTKANMDDILITVVKPRTIKQARRAVQCATTLHKQAITLWRGTRSESEKKAFVNQIGTSSEKKAFGRSSSQQGVGTTALPVVKPIEIEQPTPKETEKQCATRLENEAIAIRKGTRSEKKAFVQRIGTKSDKKTFVRRTRQQGVGTTALTVVKPIEIEQPTPKETEEQCATRLENEAIAIRKGTRSEKKAFVQRIGTKSEKKTFVRRTRQQGVGTTALDNKAVVNPSSPCIDVLKKRKKGAPPKKTKAQRKVGKKASGKHKSLPPAESEDVPTTGNVQQGDCTTALDNKAAVRPNSQCIDVLTKRSKGDINVTFKKAQAGRYDSSYWEAKYESVKASHTCHICGDKFVESVTLKIHLALHLTSNPTEKKPRKKNY